ncbi:TPA: DUF3825 domain-containing protein [Streptococcus suis]|nr:DUF3825 domain-containing protein [Streptococcus suis]HEM5092369.1 DUF3825 domain-containing protein [Streptococcus suis]HEM5140393.1 DUF3825 domain-containing protein [Streptococcus suis]HEM5282768.1 DUF3825 domain-containing protein [Streptococcus suis]
MIHTYERIKQEKKFFVALDDSYAIFNTGLFNSFHEPIYAYLEPNISTRANASKWFLVRFSTEYDLVRSGISSEILPERANYFEDPSLLIFDYNCPINIQFEHILSDSSNIERLPSDIKESPYLTNLFNGAVQSMIKKVTANYKLAVPQYYKGKIQLLLPLCLSNPDIPDLALVVTKTKDNKFYQGHTCLTMDMAYNNARLIAKPDSNWLKI